VNETYGSLGVYEADTQLLHCLQDGHHALNGVAVDNRLVRQTLVLCVALLVNDPTTQTRLVYAHCTIDKSGILPVFKLRGDMPIAPSYLLRSFP